MLAECWIQSYWRICLKKGCGSFIDFFWPQNYLLVLTKKKIVFKLIGLKVIWFGMVTLHMGILELKEGGINQICIWRLWNVAQMQTCLGSLNRVIFLRRSLFSHYCMIQYPVSSLLWSHRWPPAVSSPLMIHWPPYPMFTNATEDPCHATATSFAHWWGWLCLIS